jgi:hypothetical protein
MDIASLFMRVLDNSGDIYAPYYFDEDDGWTEDEKAIVKAIMDNHCPEKVDAGYNNWAFYKSEYGYNAKRATWRYLMFGKTLDEFCEKLRKYHEEN